jgi:hypothetical protein
MSAGIIAGAASGVASSKGGQQILGSVSAGINSQVAATQRAQKIGFTILGIVVVGALGFVAYKVLSKIAKEIKQGAASKSDAASGILEGTKVIQDLAEQGVIISRDNNFSEIASQLEYLFAGCGFNSGAKDLVKSICYE